MCLYSDIAVGVLRGFFSFFRIGVIMFELVIEFFGFLEERRLDLGIVWVLGIVIFYRFVIR